MENHEKKPRLRISRRNLISAGTEIGAGALAGLSIAESLIAQRSLMRIRELESAPINPITYTERFNREFVYGWAISNSVSTLVAAIIVKAYRELYVRLKP